MKRTVFCTIDVQVQQAAKIAFMLSVAKDPGLALVESLSITLDGAAAQFEELLAPHGTRVQVVQTHPGLLKVRYDARVQGVAAPAPVDQMDLLSYVRPSRYAESDRLAAVAAAEFRGLEGVDLLTAVAAWVGQRLAYVSGSSRPIDGAVDTLLGGAGVCRDFAHLTVALLRGLDVPARVVSVYAPGLNPMDFHAVAEAYVDGGWRVADATLLAPRSSLLRIATGHDAAQTAFMSNYGGAVELLGMQVGATVDGALPRDDPRTLVSLA